MDILKSEHFLALVIQLLRATPTLNALSSRTSCSTQCPRELRVLSKTNVYFLFSNQENGDVKLLSQTYFFFRKEGVLCAKTSIQFT